MPEIRINGLRVAYVDRGAGSPIVLLHAGAGSGKQWGKVGAILENEYRLIAPDFWGFGETARWPGPEALTHDDQARLVAEVLGAFSGEPIHLVGHSYGGAVAVRLLRLTPVRVRSLVLIEPILPRLLEQSGEGQLFAEYAAMARGFVEHAAAGDLDAAWRIFLDYRNGAGTWERLTEPAKERFRAGTQDAVAGFGSNLRNPTTLADLRGITLPTLVLFGEKTTLPDKRVSEIIHDAIPGSALSVVQGAEHMSPLTHPEPVAAAIRQHVAAA